MSIYSNYNEVFFPLQTNYSGRKNFFIFLALILVAHRFCFHIVHFDVTNVQPGKDIVLNMR